MPENPYLRRVWATLRIMGDDLDTDFITERLGLVPAHAHRRGEERVPGHQWSHGQWSLTSRDQLLPTDLEDHVAWILDRIEPVREQFLDICNGDVEADIFCFLECYGYGGPEVSPVLIGRLARLDLKLGLDIYPAWKDEVLGLDIVPDEQHHETSHSTTD